MADLHSLISHIRRFVAVPANDVEVISSFFSEMLLPKRAFFYQQGGDSQLEGYVVSGCLRAFYTDPLGNEHLLRFALEDWWVVDLGSYQGGSPALHSVQAMDETRLLVTTHAQREVLLHKLPYLERFYRLLYQNAIVALHSRIIERMSQDGATRYRTFCRRYPGLEQRLPLHQIASYLDITPQYLSKLRTGSYRAKSETS